MGTESANGSGPAATEAAPSAEPAAPRLGPAPAEPAPSAGPSAPRPPYPAIEQLTAAASSFHRWLLQPRVRLTVAGAALLLIGALMMANSVWTLPLVIVGALMVAVAWIGSRLEGRFALQWGANGTELAFRARIRPPEPVRPALAASPPEAPESPDPPWERDAPPDSPDVIDGEARTVEIEVAELEALIAAAEIGEQERGRDGAAAQAGRLRVAHGVPRRSDPPR
jgi:hypothetical protein